jgi:putative DNA primase/helicase
MKESEQINLQDVHGTALRFVLEHPFVIYHSKQFYQYVGDHYALVSDEAILGNLRRWLASKSLPIKTAAVNNLFEQVKANQDLSHLLKRHVGDLDLPVWIGKRKGEPATNRIGFKNGILDLATGKLEEHTEFWFSLNCLPFAYDPSATCPTWERFLRDVLLNDDQIRLARQWFGYCLTLRTDLQKFLYGIGPRNSGKSTFLYALGQVVGEDNCQWMSLNQLGGRFGPVNLFGKQMLLTSETSINLQGGDVVQVIKNITGEDKVFVEQKNKPGFHTFLRTRLTIVANELPRLHDDSGALLRRIMFLEFPKSFEGQEDRSLRECLGAEVPGIFNWALEGLKDLNKSGSFIVPEQNKQYAAQFADLSAPLGEFLTACCESEGFERTEYLYDAYWIWCLDTGHRPANLGVFAAKLKALWPHVERKRCSPDKTGHRPWGYSGIRLNQHGIALAERRTALPLLRLPPEAQAQGGVGRVAG